ncbi:alpha-hydroxy-acid oxidizing protein [Numidum massiliense]|uniref:alpha-hydroxy-acid oxidizing protein n=1 Tax=Numidum massiliense TaxID=1522315 RepID=UPI0009E69FDF|nr:alpha-hydroxy-acid oxidizing protein [Numidum massiliense]
MLLAPIGVNSILHCDAELAPAKAAAKLGIPYILSNVATMTIEQVAEAMGGAHRWFQLYPPRNRELTISFLRRAEAAHYAAIVVTIDSTLLGWRERDLRNAYLPFLSGDGMGNYFSDPVFCSMLDEPPEKNVRAAVLKALDEGNNTAFTWKELAFVREQTQLPLLIKGITHPNDAVLAVEHGVDGLIVSNHGGRQLDGAVATLDVLPSICEAVKGDVPVLLDSGIRRGADVIKAVALGATAVLIGRPYAYALAVAGEMGVNRPQVFSRRRPIARHKSYITTRFLLTSPYSRTTTSAFSLETKTPITVRRAADMSPIIHSQSYCRTTVVGRTVPFSTGNCSDMRKPC